MVHEYNKSPISIREGKTFIDGLEVMDSVTCSFKFTPEVWSGKQLGEQSDSSRWLGYKITGEITRRRSTPWIKEVVKNYTRTRRTPEFKIQGIMSDENSDYYQDHGTDVTTLVGVVLTGDLPLTKLDSNGEIVDDVINFSAKGVV